ncbi:MAG: SMP-30/gluconolactonase/LRE family protein [Isosphaeraceae bacterium]|nr:SMP-30/gluconolactonase/LRE family protein [Isosphaeraceae bacterium]
MQTRFTRLAIAAAFCASMGGASLAQEVVKPRDEKTVWPGLTAAGSVLLPNGWSLRPAGNQALVGDFPVAVAVHPSRPILAVLHAGWGEHEVVMLEQKSGKVISRAALKETFTGLAFSKTGDRLYVSGAFDDVVYRYDHADGYLSNRVDFAYPAPRPKPADPNEVAQRVPAGLAVAADGGFWVANVFGHSIAKFGPDGALAGEWPLGDSSFPYALALDETRNRLFVSLWNKASVAVVDTAAGKLVGTWTTQEHPNEMLLAKDGKTLYVANANRNTVSVIDTETGRALETIGTAIDPKAPSGSTPSSLALSADEKVLFVANANTNDLAVVNVEKRGESTPLGFIPTGWYPTSVRLSNDGKTIFVANGKGATSKANRDGPNPLVPGNRSVREYIAGLFRGTLSIIPLPGPAEMAAYSKTVYDCSPLASAKNVERAEGNPIPAKVGDPSPITHCVYIIKENRTYDQVFGDLPQGNGEPNLCLFPREVTPNHHALVEQFVILDNFYVDGEVSADGHEWTMGAYATDFVEKTWPLSYRGDRRVPYPAEGAQQLATPAGGYLWDRAAAKNVTYRSYGEFIRNGATPDDPATTTVKALQGHFDPKFRSYDLKYTDVNRAKRFLTELAEFEAKGEMPRLIVMRLPNDHTAGTSPGMPTVKAMVADNDVALGMVVEGLSKSKFWPKMAIFVIEDDAQNGSDHVDAHRTVALAISPYIKRGSVDSTMYSTSSMLRTMELILGLDPMSQFDAAATPMAAAFTSKPDLTPYKALPARIDLDERNTATAWGAEASKRLDLETEDRADDLVFNEIIWKAVKGPASPMPAPVRSAFFLPKR